MSAPAHLAVTPPSRAVELDRPADRLRRPVTAAAGRLGPIALGCLTLTTLLLSIGAPNTGALLPETVRPAPGWLAGPFGSSGLDLHAGGAIALLALMFGAYVVAVGAADRLSPRLVLMTIAAVHALVLLAPPMLSTDVFSYQAYARMWALHGANPYLVGPHVIASDPLYALIGTRWVNMPTAYGPLFTTLSWVTGPLSIATSVLAYKTLAAVASLATAALVWNAARLRGLNPVKATALVALNPLVVVYGVGGAHNDLLMLALLAAGVYALLSHRYRTAGAMPVLAAAIKLTAGVFLPFVLAAGSGLGRKDRRRGVLLGAALAATGILTVSLPAFGGGPLHLLSTLERAQGQGDFHSLPGLIGSSFRLVTLGHVVGAGLELAFFGVLALLVRKVWLGEMDWIDGAGWTAVALLLTAGAMQPWYVAWLMPFAALAADRRLWRTSLVVAAVVQGVALIGMVPAFS